jgi:hypothetical protein
VCFSGGTVLSFFVADESILKSSKLTPSDKLVYFGLVSFYNRKTKVCYPRVQTIADRVGLSKLTVYRSIARLKKLNIIQTRRRQSTLEYKLPLHENLLTNSRVIKFYNSELSNIISINKTKVIKPYSNYNYKNRYSQNTPFLPSQNKDIDYNGIKLQYYGSEGLIDQFRGSDGFEYTKNRLNGEIKKKTKKLA